MNLTKRATVAAIGVIGFVMYFKRDIHRLHYVYVRGLPI